MHAIEGLRGAAIVTRAGQVKLEVASGLADAEADAKCYFHPGDLGCREAAGVGSLAGAGQPSGADGRVPSRIVRARHG